MFGSVQVNKRNGEVEFLRFVMALIIFAYHFNVPRFTGKPILSTGALAVEFFLFVSGFLMVKSMLKAKENSTSEDFNTVTWLYLKRKLNSIFPEVAVSGILAILCVSICSELPFFSKFIMGINTCINEIFLLKFSGIHPDCGYNDPAWYLSSLLMALAILFPLFFRWGSRPIFLIAALAGIGLIEYFLHTIIVAGFSYFANLRVLSEVCLGAFAYYAHLKIKDIKWTPFARAGVCLFKWGIFATMLLFIIIPLFQFNGIYLILTWIYIVIIFSRISTDSLFFDKPIFYFLGKFSLPFYLGHSYVIRLCRESESWLTLPVAMKFSICFFLALCSAAVIMVLASLWRKYAGTVLALFIQQE